VVLQITVAPHGSWASPVLPEHLAATPTLGSPDVSDDAVYWLEARPGEGGRNALVRQRGSERRDLVGRDFNVRTRVHEYGGGPYWRDGETVFFSHFADGRIYRLDDGEPVPITPEPREPGSLRYADGRMLADGRIVCVHESHEGPDVVNEIAVLPADGSAAPRTLLAGNDFYAAPRPSPDGRRLAWLTWNHPLLPFAGCELWIGDLVDGQIAGGERVAGGPDESIFQPEWSPDGRLHWVSDRTGWWNLYREGENLTPTEAEFGFPAWAFDMSRYAFLADGRIACTYTRDGVASLALLDPSTRELEDLDLPYTYYDPHVRAQGSRVVIIGIGATEPPALVEIDVDSRDVQVLAQEETQIERDWVAPPEPIRFPTDDGVDAYAILYRPHNPSFRAPEGDKPPLILNVHGGPTAQAPPIFSPNVQFWTTRGFAFANLNYGGSTGYGRKFRERLDGRWGEVDVGDAVAAVRWLVDRGEVDPERVVITGGSAGGYTVLCALAFTDVFSAGVNLFGVVDLETFVADTHKFEARYMDMLVGPYPEAAELYRARSPIHSADRIRAPLLTLQGLDDRVVPPSQSEQLVAELERRGVPYAYVAFEGEGHGFRRADTLLRVPSLMLAFLARVFGFEPADELEPLHIRGLSPP
jgi:dipeptidyl aminopeptidase/acylaminoacyl peptidase